MHLFFFFGGASARTPASERLRLHSPRTCNPRCPAACGGVPRSRLLRFSHACTWPIAATGDYNKWLHQHPEEGRGGGCQASAWRSRHRDEGKVAEKRRQRCNTRSTFETFGCNTCNICLKLDETHETCI
jgi:hypothetical protein